MAEENKKELPLKETKNLIVIDAKNAVLGRLASYAVKQALLGKTIAIVNCSETLITGKKRSIIEEYQETKARGGSALKGPFFPKSPERILKRTIRGMISYKKARGLDAFKRIKCYNKVPREFEEAKKILAGKEKKTKTIKLSELSKEI